MSEADVVLAPARAVSLQMEKFAQKLNLMKETLSGIDVSGIEKTADAMDALGSKIRQLMQAAKSGTETLMNSASSLMKSGFTAEADPAGGNTATDFAQSEKANTALAPQDKSVSAIMASGKDDIFSQTKENLGEASEVMDNFIDRVNSMKEGMKTLGSGALKAVDDCAGVLTKIESETKKLEKIFKSMDTFKKVGDLFSTYILPVFTKIGEVFALVSGGAGTLSEAFGAVFFTVSPVVLAIGALIAVFAALYVSCEDFRTFINEIVADVATGFFETVGEIQQKFMEIAGIIQLFIEENQPVIDGFIAVLKGIFEVGFVGIATIVQNAMLGIQCVISSVLDVIRGHIEFIFNTIRNIVHAFMEIIQGVIDIFMGIISGNWSRAWNGVKEVFGGIWDGIVGTFINIKDRIAGIFTDLASNCWTWGKDMIKGLIDGLKSMIDAVGNVVGSIAGKIKSFLHFSRPDVGPLRDYETWMPDFMQGLADGIMKNKSHVIDALKELTSDMQIFEPVEVSGLVSTGALFQENEEPDRKLNGSGNRPVQSGSAFQDAAGSFYPLMYNAYVQALTNVRPQTDVKVLLEGDARGIFRVVQTEAGRYMDLTGTAPFPV